MDKLGFDNVDPEQNQRYFESQFAAEIDAATVIPLLGEDETGFTLIDVRDPDSYESGHVEGAINLPFEQLGKNLSDLDEGGNYLVYCYDAPCMLSARAARMMSSKGFKVKDVVGGFEDFEKKGAPIETGSGPQTVAVTAGSN